MKPICIGIAGGTAAGKTTVLRRVVQVFGEDKVSVLQHDWYYRDRNHMSPGEREHLNYDHPDSLETSALVEHLRQLLRGCPVEAFVYDFVAHTRSQQTLSVEPHRVIIVEGVLALVDSRLRELMDIRIFMDTEDDLRFIRRLQRDTKQRGRSVESVIRQYLATVRPMHLKYVEPTKQYADIVIPGGGSNDEIVETLTAEIRSSLRAHFPPANRARTPAIEL